MTGLIIKLFINNKERTEDAKRLRFGIVGGVCGIITNLILAVFKAAVGFLFGSIAIVADAVNNMTDAASSVITLVGFKLASKKPDGDHPYGHGRMEYLSGLIMSFVVLMLGVTLTKDAFLSILSPESITFSYLTIIVLVASILAKLWLSFFYKRLEKETGSKTFAAASVDSRNDVISTFAVLVSTVIYKFTSLNLDGYIGFVVSVIIVISAIGLVKETIDPLLGQPPSKELVQAIEKKVMSHDGIIGIHDLVVHNYGPGRIFASIHAEVDAEGDLLESHDLIDNIEKEFRDSMNLEMVIHIDPVVTNDPKIAMLKAAVEEIVQGIDCAFTLHDFRAVTGPTHTNLIFDVVLPQECALSEKNIKETIDSRLRENHPECNTVIVFDRSYV